MTEGLPYRFTGRDHQPDDARSLEFEDHVLKAAGAYRAFEIADPVAHAECEIDDRLAVVARRMFFRVGGQNARAGFAIGWKRNTVMRARAVEQRRDDAVVVMSAEDYDRLAGQRPGFKQLLMDGPGLDKLDLKRDQTHMRDVQL